MAKKPDNQQAKQRMVLFVHGIRDTAFWQHKLRTLFEAEQVVAKPIGFHVFDVFSFLFGFRRKAVERVKQQIEAAIANHPDAHVTVIAHSFGTYAVARILNDDPNVKIDRLVMCGAIVPRRYRWDKVSRLNAKNGKLDIVNEFSARDIWPLFARHATFGFGDVGTIGCQDTHVVDRRHSIRHGEYLSENFAKTYWLPWLANGEPLANPKAPDANPWYFAVNRSPVTMVAGVLALATFLGAHYVNDRNNFRTQGEIEFETDSSATFEITGYHDKEKKISEVVYSAVDSEAKTLHRLFSDSRFKSIRVVVRNRRPIVCNSQALENSGDSNAATSYGEAINNAKTLFDLDLSRAYNMTGKANLRFSYESDVKESETVQQFDRLTVEAGDGIDHRYIKVTRVDHTVDDCLDDTFRRPNYEPFVVTGSAEASSSGLLSSLFPNAFAGARPKLSRKLRAPEIRDYLRSPRPALRTRAIETIVANPTEYAKEVKSLIDLGDGSDNELADLILAARTANGSPIDLSTSRLIELSYSGNGPLRDAARSYLRSANLVNDGVAKTVQAAVDDRLEELSRRSVPGSSFNQDYLLLVTARDIYYNLGFKKLDNYVKALRHGQKPDLGPVLDAFKKGRQLRDRAANTDQKIALSKNTYGLAYALYIVAMNQEAVAEGKGQLAEQFLDNASQQGLPVKDQAAAPFFGEFLAEISSSAKLYPWPAHIEQAKRCNAAFSFGCLDRNQSSN